MGYYVNPHNESKEAFLEREGTPLTPSELVTFDFKSDRLPVCWVKNPSFTAAGIAVDAWEMQRFINGMAGRQNRWYSVPRAALTPWYREE